MRGLLLLLVVLQCIRSGSSWLGVLINTGQGTQIWSPYLSSHGETGLNFNIPANDFGRAARLSNGKVYFVGGDGNANGTTYIFDPTTNTTMAGAPLNQPCSGTGRSRRSSKSSSTFRIAPCRLRTLCTSAWPTAHSPSVIRRHSFGITIFYDTIVVCGGYSAGDLLLSCEQFNVTDNATGDGKWAFLNALLPGPMANLAMATALSPIAPATNLLYVIGGSNGTFHICTLDIAICTIQFREATWLQ